MRSSATRTSASSSIAARSMPTASRASRGSLAVAPAAVDADGLPDVRMVLMKGFDADGFVFYSHIASAK
ncbi:hypothetical protein FNJ47_21885, partial [Bradyrhizobium sp. UFLA 03-164]|nr:hypothetical protein [Bradyrhizobium uaiense]